MSQPNDDLFRWLVAAMIAAAAAVGIPFRLRADRVGGKVSRRVDPKWFWRGMALVGPASTITCLAFLIQPRWVEFARMPLPVGVRLAGVPVALAGIFLFGWMFRHLGLNVTSTSAPRANATLVTSGPYRWVRHPMYSAALLLAIAATLFTANVIMLIGGLGMFVLLAARSRVEEGRLIERFGEAYRSYQRTTAAFFPWRFRQNGIAPGTR